MATKQLLLVHKQHGNVRHQHSSSASGKFLKPAHCLPRSTKPITRHSKRRINTATTDPHPHVVVVTVHALGSVRCEGFRATCRHSDVLRRHTCLYTQFIASNSRMFSNRRMQCWRTVHEQRVQHMLAHYAASDEANTQTTALLHGMILHTLKTSTSVLAVQTSGRTEGVTVVTIPSTILHTKCACAERIGCAASRTLMERSMSGVTA